MSSSIPLGVNMRLSSPLQFVEVLCDSVSESEILFRSDRFLIILTSLISEELQQFKQVCTTNIAISLEVKRTTRKKQRQSVSTV